MKLQNEYQDIVEYMSQWIDRESWDDMQCMANAASVGCPNAIKYMARHLMSTGCIDSENCYVQAKTLEQDVELLAKQYRGLSKKAKNLVYDRIFTGVLFISCYQCNHHSFVADGNERLYPELLTQCWHCNNSTTLEVKRYEPKRIGRVK